MLALCMHVIVSMVSPQDSLQQQFLQLGRRITGQLTEFIEKPDPRVLDYLIYLSEQLYMCLNVSGEPGNVDDVAEVITLLLSLQNESDNVNGNLDVCAVIRNGRPGRPSYAVSEEQLHLFHIGFSATHITSMVGVSVRTIRRRMDNIRLQVSDLYSTLSDNELDIIINEILIQFPNTGYRMMAGHLKRRGVQV